MAYCTQSDLELRIGVEQLAMLTNDTAGTAMADPTVITALISRSDTLIDALMTGVYVTPFVSTPKIIKQCSIDMTIYSAFLRRFASTEVPKEWIAANKQAMEFLDLIANLELQLDSDPAVTSGEADFVAPDKLIDFTDSNNAASDY